MAAKVPIRTVFDGDGNATGLAEFQSGEFVDYDHGGTGLAALGSAGQVLKVNSGGTALEYGAVEAVFNIDGMSDGGTEKYVLASDIQSYIEGSAINITGSLQVSGKTVATQPFAIAQAIALG